MHDINGFARMLNKAMDVRSLTLDTLAEGSGIGSRKIHAWCERQYLPSEAPTSVELAGIAEVLELPQSDVESWLTLDSVPFDEQIWLLASVLIPGLSQENWINAELTLTQQEEEEELGNILGLEQALILLVMKYRPGIVARKAQELFLQTKEGKEHQAQAATSFEDAALNARSPSPGARAGGSPSKLEQARKLLGG